MPVSSINSPRFNSAAYSEKIPGFFKEVFTGKKEPLNVLYIQGLDDTYEKTKKMSREHLNEEVRSGEIKVNNLEGNSADAKLKKLEQTLLALRQQGRINEATQIILSCKPGENPGELDIGRNGSAEVWKVKDVIDAIRGGRTTGQLPSPSDFHGAIHIFGHSHEEFKPEDRKQFGNVLMHASGKFNWSHHHAFMIGHIVRASKNIKDGSPEQITRQVRDAIQPYAGYPIYRISNDKVKIKYPSFHNPSAQRTEFYINSIKNHKKPIDMLISSVERDSIDTLQIRMNTGGLLSRIKDKRNDLASYETLKARLLGAVVCSKKDQAAKLQFLTDTLEMDFSRLDPQSWIGTALQAEISRNRDRLDPSLIAFLEEMNFEIVPENQYVEFISNKIMQGKLPDLITKFPNILTRLDTLDCKDVCKLTYAAFHSPECKSTIGMLWSCGLKFKSLTEDQLKSIVEQFDQDPVAYTILIDALADAGAISAVETLGKSEKFIYNLLSSNPQNQEKIRQKLVQGISDNDSNLPKLVEESIYAAVESNNVKPMKFLMDCGLPPDFIVKDGQTVIHCACTHQPPSAELIELLCQRGANLKMKSQLELSAIDFLQMNVKIDLQQMEKILRILVAKDNSILGENDKYNLKPVHYAASQPNPVFVEALLKIEPAYVNNVCDDQQMTPLHVAIVSAYHNQKKGSLKKTEFLKVVDILLKNNADLDAKDANDVTPRQYMSEFKEFESFDLEARKSKLLRDSNLVAV